MRASVCSEVDLDMFAPHLMTSDKTPYQGFNVYLYNALDSDRSLSKNKYSLNSYEHRVSLYFSLATWQITFAKSISPQVSEHLTHSGCSLRMLPPCASPKSHGPSSIPTPASAHLHTHHGLDASKAYPFLQHPIITLQEMVAT